jgi:hypothetical protein
MKKALTVAILATAGIAASANANLIAYWNFNNSTPGTTGGLGTLAPAGFNANQGAGTLTTNFSVNTVAGSASANNGDLGTFGGTAANALAPDDTTSTGNVGGALALRTGNGLSGSQTNNGKWVQFNVSTVGIVSSLAVTYVTQRTGTGFTSQQWQFSTDGVNFTNLALINTIQGSSPGFVLNSAVLQTVSITNAAAYGVANLRIRVIFDGAASNAFGGNNRLDNVQINGTIPTPGSLALVGVAGLMAARRRRA